MIRRACLFVLALFVLPAAAAVELKGWLELVQEVDMRVVENGVVEEVAVSTGQRVEQGDLLLRMDQREATARLLESKAILARARINTERAARELERTRELYDRGLIAQEELKDAELEDAAAAAEEESAKASVAAAEVALERTELRAPYNGVVVARNVWEGEVVYKTLQQEPLLVIAPDGFMLARALVTADLLRRVRPGQRAAVRILGEVREAHVYSLGVEPVRVDLQGAVYALDLIFERRPEELLRPSEKVQIIVP
jgi:RND family efflux transporter MFP subunit